MLARGSSRPGERCEIAGFGPVPFAAIRDLINQILQTALLANGWACDNPDCPHRHRLERDHVQALTNGGMTAFFNLRPLCKGGCHQAKTHDDMREHRRRRRSRSP